MSNEDFLTYSEGGADDRLTETSSRVTATNMTNADETYLFDDKGIDSFEGASHEFEHILIGTSDNNNQYSGWALSNLLGDQKAIEDASGDELAAHIVDITGATIPSMWAVEIDGGTFYFDAGTIDITTLRYFTVDWDISTGTYGTLFIHTYQDSAKTIPLETLSIALHSSQKKYRYIYGMQSRDVNFALRISSGYTQNLNLNLDIVILRRRMEGY